MEPVYNTNAPKKATNLSLNSDLLNKAKMMNINLSAVCEQALTELVKQKQRELWLKENQAAIDACNKLTEEKGVFSDGMRGF